MMSLRKMALLASCLSGLTALPSLALAQTTGAEIEELVVTAEKRTQSIQDVPVAITAFTAERRDLVGISSVVDMANFTPGLNYTAGLDRLTLRGIGRLTNNLASEGGVANYIDGVYSSSTVGAGNSSLFTERVEVLRGPQGTLYGRNSIGGAINTINKRPDKEYGGEVRAVYANYDRQFLAARVSLPVAEHLRFSLGASYLNQDKGYFKNYSGGPDEGGINNYWYYEGQLQAELGDNVDIWARAAFSQYNNRAQPGGGRSGGSYATIDPALFTPGSLSASATFAFNPAALNPIFTGPIRGNTVLQTGDIRGFSSNIPNENDQESESLTAHVTWRLPGMELKYVTGYSKYDYVLTTDFDSTAVVAYQVPLTANGLCATLQRLGQCAPLTVVPQVPSVYEEHKENWSHELNLASSNDSNFQWIAGAYYYFEKYTQPVNIGLPGQAQLASPLGAPANPSRVIYYTNQDMRAESRAVFGQIDWRFAENFKITGGLRYTKDKKKGSEETRQLCFGLPSCLQGLVAAVPGIFGPTITPANVSVGQLGTLTPVTDITASTASGLRPTGVTAPQLGVVGPAVTNPLTGIRSRALAYDWDAVTGTLGLEWQPDADTLAYARYSRGYKAGGFNTGTIQAFPTTQEEHVNAYELGLKKDWTRRFQTNVSAFYYDYTDAQTLATYQPETGPRYSAFFNLPKSRVMGLEAETTWAATENLRFFLTYAYLDAEIREACCIVDADDPTAILPGAKPSGPAGTIDAATGRPTQPQDLKGETLPLSPKHKVALNAIYTWTFQPGRLTASMSYFMQSSVYSSFFNRPFNKAPAKDQVDGRLTWTDADDRYTVIAYVQNLLDEDEYETRSGSRNSVGLIQSGGYTLAPPRTYGVELQYRF